MVPSYQATRKLKWATIIEFYAVSANNFIHCGVQFFDYLGFFLCIYSLVFQTRYNYND